MMRKAITLRALAKVAAPFNPPPPHTAYRWLKMLGGGKVVDGQTTVTADELAAMSLFGWLRLGTPVKIQAAKRVAQSALRLLKREPAVVILVRLTRSGAEVEIGKEAPSGALGVFCYHVADVRDRMRELIEKKSLHVLDESALSSTLR